MRTLESKMLQGLDEWVRPEHTALLIVDMQNDYCSAGGAQDRRGTVDAAQDMIPNLRELLTAARQHDVLPVFVRMGLDEQGLYLSGPDAGKRLKRWGMDKVAIKGTWGYEIVPELAPLRGELVVEKHRGSGFEGTDLDMILRSNLIRSVVVTGVVTQGCVDATLRDAVNADYYVVACTDCVASGKREFHEMAIKLWEGSLEEGAVTTSDQVIAAWERAAVPARASAAL